MSAIVEENRKKKSFDPLNKFYFEFGETKTQNMIGAKSVKKRLFIESGILIYFMKLGEFFDHKIFSFTIYV